MAARTQKPLELILARNLLTSISTPAILLDPHGAMVFYNEAAGALLGRSFEDAGRMSPQEWISIHGPFDSEGKPIPLDDMPATQAVRKGRPAYGVSRIRSAGGADHEVESSTFPIVASDQGASGAMVLFWPLNDKDGEGARR